MKLQWNKSCHKTAVDNVDISVYTAVLLELFVSLRFYPQETWPRSTLLRLQILSQHDTVNYVVASTVNSRCKLHHKL